MDKKRLPVRAALVIPWLFVMGVAVYFAIYDPVLAGVVVGYGVVCVAIVGGRLIWKLLR